MFPYIVDNNFERAEQSGVTLSGFDSETDTAGQLDIVHAKDLAKMPYPSAVPYRGAYCLRAQLTGGTAAAYLVEGDANVAANTNNFFRFYVWFSPDFAATADDDVTLFQLIATATVEVNVGFRITATTGVIVFGIGETGITSVGTREIERGVWYCVELDVTIDNDANDDGTIDIYVTRDGEPAATAVYAAQVGSLDQGAITECRIGPQNHLATTTGVILFDQLVHDDTRVFPITDRWTEERVVTVDDHVFIGRGTVRNVSLMAGAGTDNVVTLYDTARGNIDDHSNFKARLTNTANNELVDPAGMPASFIRGCYVRMEGTNPRALVQIDCANGYGGEAQVKNAALRVLG